MHYASLTCIPRSLSTLKMFADHCGPIPYQLHHCTGTTANQKGCRSLISPHNTIPARISSPSFIRVSTRQLTVSFLSKGILNTSNEWSRNLVLKYHHNLLISTSYAHYQQQLAMFVNHCDANFLELNVPKTKEMIIDFKISCSSPSSIILKGSKVDRVSSYKYLGIMIDDKLAWHDHIDYLIRRLNVRMYCFRKLNCFHVAKRILALFYKSWTKQEG